MTVSVEPSIPLGMLGIGLPALTAAARALAASNVKLPLPWVTIAKLTSAGTVEGSPVRPARSGSVSPSAAASDAEPGFSSGWTMTLELP